MIPTPTRNLPELTAEPKNGKTGPPIQALNCCQAFGESGIERLRVPMNDGTNESFEVMMPGSD